MGSFKRALFGYRRPEVDAAIESREGRIRALGKQAAEAERRAERVEALERQVAELRGRAAESQRRAELIGELEREAVALVAAMSELERETASLAGMVVEREREIRNLGERLREANERHDRSIDSLGAISTRLEEVQAQARGQATRIRMKALREAVEVSRRVQALTDVEPGVSAAADEDRADGDGAEELEAPTVAAMEPPADAALVAEEVATALADGLYAGQVKVEIGPLGDFAQLVGFEDAVGQVGASEISVERFSEGRATLSMRLEEPTELLRELEQLSNLDFRVRHTAPDSLILDVDDDSGSGQRAA